MTTLHPPSSQEPSSDEFNLDDPSLLAPQVADLFLADPLSLTEEDLSFLAQYYQTKRLEFTIAEQRPKTVRSSRGPKLDKEASKAKLKGLLNRMVGEKKTATIETAVEDADTEGEDGK